MFFMFSIFSLLSSHDDTTQQKKPQEVEPQAQFMRRVDTSSVVPEGISGIAESYNLNEQSLASQPIAQQSGAVSSMPIMPMRQMSPGPAHAVPQPATIVQPPPIVINNYTNCSPSTNMVSSNQNQSDVQMNNAMSAHVSASMSAYMVQAQQMVHEGLPQRIGSLQALLWEYRYRVTGGCIVVAYVLLCYHFYKALQYLSHKTVWSSWRNDLSMEELLAQDITALGKSLIIAIQMRYANSQNPTDFIAPLVAFNIQIQQEIDYLRAYWRLYMVCKNWRLVKIVPFSIDRLDALKEHIERAIYVQTVFKTWTANYNFVQNVRAHVA